MAEVRNELLSLCVEEKDELYVQQLRLENCILELSLKIRKMLQLDTGTDGPSDPSKESNNIRLPILEIPDFDGDLLNWSFWERFSISIHEKTNLSNAEKLVYLRQALKVGTAKHLIEGLSDVGDCYAEAIECLKARFDRPRLIHQAHVKAIVEAPVVREGSGKELRRLHDVLQHLRALRAMGHDVSTSFITSLVELKLDATTSFDWQRHSQDEADFPSHQNLMDFIDLRARASESSPSAASHQKNTPSSSSSKGSFGNRHVGSYAVTTSDKVYSYNLCVICKAAKHPPYACTKFRALYKLINNKLIR